MSRLGEILQPVVRMLDRNAHEPARQQTLAQGLRALNRQEGGDGLPALTDNDIETTAVKAQERVEKLLGINHY